MAGACGAWWAVRSAYVSPPYAVPYRPPTILKIPPGPPSLTSKPRRCLAPSPLTPSPLTPSPLMPTPPLLISPPAFVSGCRHNYHVSVSIDGEHVSVGQLYVVSAEYPNHPNLARPVTGRVTFTAVAHEQVSGAAYRHPASVASAAGTPLVMEAAGKSDAELLSEAAAQLYALSAELTATYAREPAHYVRGAWQAGYIGTPRRETWQHTAAHISARSIRYGDGGIPLFYARHKSGQVLRLMPYWREEDPGYAYSRRLIAWQAYPLSSDAAPLPLPKHLTDWLTSRLDCV